MKWNYFIAAMLIVSVSVLLMGAPVLSVVAGNACAALWNWHKRKIA